MKVMIFIELGLASLRDVILFSDIELISNFILIFMRNKWRSVFYFTTRPVPNRIELDFYILAINFGTVSLEIRVVLSQSIEKQYLWHLTN